VTNRIIFGNRNGQPGIWVSKPGVNVLTATDDGLLFSSDRQAVQIVASGVITGAGNNTNHDIAIPNLGFKSLVITGGGVVTAYSFPNATTLRLSVYTRQPYADYVQDVHWALTNLRLPI